MKKLLLTLALACAPAPLLAQGAFIPPQIALKNINGIVMPLANATITVCGPNAGGIPCSPPLTNTIFKDAALTEPLPNPFTSDPYGNYQFAALGGTYTVTVTAPGFAGYSYQIADGTGGFYQTVYVQEVALPQEPIISFDAGTGIAIGGADSPGSQQTIITIAAADPTVQYSVSGTYAQPFTQSYPAGTIILVPTNGTSPSWSAGSLFGCQGVGDESILSVCIFDGSSYPFMLNSNMTVDDLAPGSTGTVGTPAVNQDSPQLTGHPGIASSIFTGLADPTAANGDWVDVGPGVGGSPGCQWPLTPGDFHGKQCVDTAGNWNFSYNDDGPYIVTRTVAAGVVSMTTAAIANGACGNVATGTATVGSLTNLAANEIVSWSFSGTPAANPGILAVAAWTGAGSVSFRYCNGSGGSVTPTATTLYWSVRIP